MYIFKFIAFIILLGILPSPAFAITGSITDPGFISEEKQKESDFPLRGALRTRLSRSVRRSEWKHFFDIDHADNLFSTLSIKMDLTLSYPVTKLVPSLEESYFFDKESSLFFVLGYRRPVYPDSYTLRLYCWKPYICFSDLSLGLSNTLFKKDRLSSSYSLYLSFPTSVDSWDRKKIIGIGAAANASYLLLPWISGISSHFLDVDIPYSMSADEQGMGYNNIFSVFNQIGLRLSYLKSAWIPMLLVYCDYLFALNYKMRRIHNISIGFSSVWSLSKQLQIVAGFRWGSDVFLPKDAAKAIKADPFNPDETYVNLGFSYSF